MTRRRPSAEEKLEALHRLALGSDPQRDREALAAALDDRHARVVAKAAELAAERLFYDLGTSLLAAYQRFLIDPVKRDPNCLAKQAIVRALVTLEFSRVDFYLEGIRYRQMEPVWGGSIDTAIDIRNGCAMGLVASGYGRALIELTALLADPEARARQGAVRAIACGNPREAETLLQFKVLVGDEEPEVTGECFTALLSVAPEEGAHFVANYLNAGNEAVRELAALALGECRQPQALAFLQRAWTEEILDRGFRRTLLRAAALHRSDEAVDWLLAIVREGHVSHGEAVLEALAIYRHQSQLTAKLEDVLRQRGERRLNDAFARLWH